MTIADAPLRILVSAVAARQYGAAISEAMGTRAHLFVTPDGSAVDADLAFFTRDVTGLSTKHELQPGTRVFFDALRDAPSLRWVHTYSAGADRPIFLELMARGVAVSTSSGASAEVVAQAALTGLLALQLGLPKLMAAQKAHVWAPVMNGKLPRDLSAQHATIVGWGPIGQKLGALLQALGLRISVVRSSAESAGEGLETVAFEQMNDVLPRTDWLVLACPLSDRTRELVGRAALAALPPTARLVNVARGEVVDEPALIEALQQGRLDGAYLDVFAHEPLPATSPLWDMPNVICTPHCASFSDGNAARVVPMFTDNLRRWCAGQPLLREVRVVQ